MHMEEGAKEENEGGGVSVISAAATTRFSHNQHQLGLGRPLSRTDVVLSPSLILVPIRISRTVYSATTSTKLDSIWSAGGHANSRIGGSALEELFVNWRNLIRFWQIRGSRSLAAEFDGSGGEGKGSDLEVFMFDLDVRGSWIWLQVRSSVNSGLGMGYVSGGASVNDLKSGFSLIQTDKEGGVWVDVDHWW